MVPAIQDAVVVAQDGANYKLLVLLQGAMGCQGPTLSVEVGLQGHNDGVRGHWPPLPAVGTHGTVAFSRGDIRNGRWISSHRSNLTDSCSHTSATPNLEYWSDYGGGWRAITEDGSVYLTLPDNSKFTIGGSGFVPMRNTLSETFAKQQVPFTQSERVAVVPAPFPFQYVQGGTGVSIIINASGAIVVSGIASQPVEIIGGGCSITMQGGTITMVGAVNMSSTLNCSGTVTTSGGIVAGDGGGDRVTLQGHVHLESGGGTTNAPIAGT